MTNTDHIISALQLGNLYGLLNIAVYMDLSLHHDRSVNDFVDNCNSGTSIVCTVWISSWDTVFGSFTNCSTISGTGSSGICSTVPRERIVARVPKSSFARVRRVLVPLEPHHMEDEDEGEDQENEKEDERDGEEQKGES